MALEKNQIIAKVITKLKTVTIANGYNTNAGNNVYEGRTKKFADTEIPGFNLRESNDPVENIEQQGASGVWERMLQLEIDMMANGEVAPENLRKVEADAQKAIGTNLTWDGLAVMTYLITVFSVYSEHDENRLEKKTMIINIHYKTTEWSA